MRMNSSDTNHVQTARVVTLLLATLMGLAGVSLVDTMRGVMVRIPHLLEAVRQ